MTPPFRTSRGGVGVSPSSSACGRRGLRVGRFSVTRAVQFGETDEDGGLLATFSQKTVVVIPAEEGAALAERG